MARTLDFIQVIYDDSQRAELYPFAKEYFNTTLSPYFENKIIADLVPDLKSDLISICSWRLRKKRGDCQIGLQNDLELTEDKLLSCVDVGILTPRSPIHKPLQNAVIWHGQAWVDAFKDFRYFLDSIGIKVPDELRYTIYENHFITRRDIYHDYVTNVLTPAIAYMDSRPKTYLQESGYNNKKKDRQEKERVHKALGLPDWPIAPFILERLFSIYIDDKGFNVKPI